MERRNSTRSQAAQNVQLYCQELGIRRLRPVDISARGVYIKAQSPVGAPKGKMVKLIFIIDKGSLVKIARISAYVARVSDGGMGFGFSRDARRSAWVRT